MAEERGETAASHTVALLQTEPSFGEVVANLDRVDAAIEGLRCDLLVLPELFASGYAFADRAELASLAEPASGGPTSERMRTWSRHTGALVVGGFPERADGKTYNAALLAAHGEVVGSYRKLHLFGFERELFDRGDTPLTVHEHRGLRTGTMVCFDWIFPEAARALALLGADVIAHPSNLVLPGWCQRAMEIRGLENRVFTATANRVGREHRPPRPALAFTGRSQITSPAGEVLARAPEGESALVTARIDLQQARAKSIPSGNDLWAERRPDQYGRLTEEP